VYPKLLLGIVSVSSRTFNIVPVVVFDMPPTYPIANPKEGFKKLGSVMPNMMRCARPGESVGSVPNQKVSKPTSAVS
jgi:hypothetical protein